MLDIVNLRLRRLRKRKVTFSPALKAPGSTLIRILSIQPARRQSDPIKCHFHLINLHDAPPYQALSYAWGTEAFTEKIQLDGTPVRVSPTLKAALTRIRSHWDQRHLLYENARPNLWVDALCVNQSDNEEKSAQVMLMGEIYTNAKCVLVWLGEHASGSNVFRIAEAIAQSASGTTSDCVSGHADAVSECRNADAHVPWNPYDLYDLVTLPWFGRRWVVQETWLQKTRWTLLGGCVFPLDALPPALEQRALGYIWLSRPNNDSVKEPSLLECLMRCSQTKCRDPLDLIYALRALGVDGGDIQVNYGGVDAVRVFVDLASKYACTKWLPWLLICALEFPSKTTELPTWVPDWREVKTVTESLEFHKKMLNISSFDNPDRPDIISSTTISAHAQKLVFTTWTARDTEHEGWTCRCSYESVDTTDVHPAPNLYIYLDGTDVVFALRRNRGPERPDGFELMYYVECSTEVRRSGASSVDELVVTPLDSWRTGKEPQVLRMRMRSVEIV